MSSNLPDWWGFIRSVDKGFDGTFFYVTLLNGTEEKFSVSENPKPEYWYDLLDKFKEARKCDPRITLTIAFCIAYHNAIQKPREKKGIFGQKVSENFPVPQEVTDFFSFRPLFQLWDQVEYLASQLRSSNSDLLSLKDLNESSVTELKEILDNLEAFKQDLANIESEFHKALSEQNELRWKTFSDQLTDGKKYLSSREKMVFDQKQAIYSIQVKLNKLAQTQRQANSALLEAKKRFLSELSKLGKENVPPKFVHFFEATSNLSRHFKRMSSTCKVAASLVVRQSVMPEFLQRNSSRNMVKNLVEQQAGLNLASHLRMFSAQKIVHPQIRASRQNCAICLETKPKYFILGCGHGLYCMDCIGKIQNKSCPTCRKPILSCTDFAMFNGKVFLQ